MSMELYVLSDKRLASIAEWQQAIDADGFAVRLSAKTPFEALNGILPVRLGGRQTDFECAHWDASALMEESPDIDFGHRWTYALAFRWGADIYAGTAAYMAGAAYARATDGVVLDCEEGKILSPQRAAEIARDLDKSMPDIDAALQKVIAQFRLEASIGCAKRSEAHGFRPRCN